MKNKYIVLALAILLLLVSTTWLKGEGKFSGWMIGDYYYTLKHHDTAVKDNNGFWFRRIYFTYDNTLTDKIAMRFRLEANSPGDFKTSSTLIPYVKDAYLSTKIGKHSLMLGLIGTNMYDNVENFWGYRPMEKTPIDLFRFGNSREMGLGLKGTLDKKGKLSYAVVLGNGDGTKSETDCGKAVHGRLNFQPVPALFLELYADYTNLGNDSSVNIFQAFAGIKGGWGRGGFNFGVSNAKQADNRSDTKFVSVFGVFKLSKKVDFISRFDRLLDPNPNGSRIAYIPMADNVRANVFLAGLGWSLSENVKIIPNVKFIFYDAPASGEKPAADLYTYLTLYFKF
ncbi:MAG: hypothetical protein E4H23_03645 [Chrysiogenales bacterium]|nr:hypothetical protein [Candidatus Aminicenantes bacterium]TFG80114.1 MAG: hypothetical protein E4H23_03645 [Chrysiogenales bacterium]